MRSEPSARQPYSLPQWLSSPAGEYLLAWEQSHCDRVLSDVFGYHALQVGLAPLHALRGNRMPKQWLAADVWPELSASGHVSLYTDPVALPFAAASLDLIVLPHTLDWCSDPHAALREVERVLVPEGRVLIFSFNPRSEEHTSELQSH